MPNAASLEFIPPQLNGRVLAGARRLLPLWLRRAGLRGVRVEGMERLQVAMEAFQGGRSRLLLAFRHPSLDDPAVMAHLLWIDLARAGRPGSEGERRRRFRPRPHAQFLYDRGIPLWAGTPVGWLLSHLGGCSIQRSKLDLPALRTARALLLDGPYPFAVAPEGSTNGHNEVISPLEPGVAQLALWTSDDLARAGRPEATTLLPIGLQYSFTTPVWPAIERLLRELETEVGLPPAADRSLDAQQLYGRLFALARVILTRMERFYRDAYHQPLPKAPDGATAASGNASLEPGGQAPQPSGRTSAGGQASQPEVSREPGDAAQAPAAAPADNNSDLGARLSRLMEAALQVAERALAVEGRGDVNERCRRLEQAGWDRLYPASGTATSPASALERGLASRLAEQTAQQLWHMRLVESFVAVSGSYVKDDPSQERFADTLLILWDTLCRIRGGNPERRPRLGNRRAQIRIGEPIAVAPRLAAYRADRRSAVANLTADLQREMEELIVPSGDGFASGNGGHATRTSAQPTASRAR
jgi:1-acyl-sn-glycerol-3-phosphate acyltransferase